MDANPSPKLFVQSTFSIKIIIYILLLSDKSFQAENNSLIYSMLYENFSNGAYP